MTQVCTLRCYSLALPTVLKPDMTLTSFNVQVALLSHSLFFFTKLITNTEVFKDNLISTLKDHTVI